MVLNLDSSASSLDESLATNTPPRDINPSCLASTIATTQQQHVVTTSQQQLGVTMQQSAVVTTRKHSVSATQQSMVKTETGSEQSNDHRSASIIQHEQHTHDGKLALDGTSVVSSDMLVPSVNGPRIGLQAPAVSVVSSRRAIPPPLPTIQQHTHQPVSTEMCI